MYSRCSSRAFACLRYVSIAYAAFTSACLHLKPNRLEMSYVVCVCVEGRTSVAIPCLSYAAPDPSRRQSAAPWIGPHGAYGLVAGINTEYMRRTIMGAPYDSSVDGLKKQAEDDARSSKCLFEKRHYGTSAYLCQQSVEKTVKSVMVEYKLTRKSAKQLRHTPLAELLDMLSCDAKRLASETEDAGTKEGYDGLSNLLKLGVRIFQQPKNEETFTRMAWWKTSLGMGLTPNEAGKIRKRYSSLTKEYGEPMNELLKHLTELAGSKRARNAYGKNITKMVEKGLANLTVPRASDSSNTHSVLLFELVEGLRSMCVVWVRIAQQLQNTRLTMYPYTALLMWTVENAILILMITPHEDIGRYPIRVCGRESIDWYGEKQKKLEELEDLIDEARKELPGRMLRNSRQQRPRIRIPKWLDVSGSHSA